MCVGSMALYGYRAVEGASIAMSSAVVGSGMASLTPGPIQIVVGAIVYTAMMGISYRKLKKGEITKKQFKKQAGKGACGTTGALVGVVAGSFVGFALG